MFWTNELTKQESTILRKIEFQESLTDQEIDYLKNSCDEVSDGVYFLPTNQYAKLD